jgi:hypothetical protein
MSVINCDPTDPPIINSSGFFVDGQAGEADFDGSGGSSNPPKSNSIVEAFANITGEQIETVYQYFLDDEAISVSNPYTIPEGTGVPGKYLKCNIIVSNAAGQASDTVEMGIVYGLLPEIPTNITTFASFDPPVGGIVEPGDIISVTYNTVLTSSGDPDPTISTIINGNEYTGNSISHTVSVDEQNCKVILDSVSVNNEDPGIPGTSDGEISRTFNFEICGVQDPIDGSPCGDALGSCCVTGGFNPVTGITSGSCTTETEADCLALVPPGKWTAQEPCPECDGSVGTPCCDEIGTGRCCCIQTDNTGLCIPNVTAEECDVSDPRFANCGSTDTAGEITWTFGEECPDCVVGVPDPPCCAPYTGRCCEVVLENENGIPVGATCEVGLEDVDCPRYVESDPDNFVWTPAGICISCEVPELNSGEPCCNPLGRCCLRSGQHDRIISYDITEAACEGKRRDEGWEFKDWTQNNPNESSADSGLELDCTDPAVASANPNCCPPLGRCCFRPRADGYRLAEGKCYQNMTLTDCDVLRTNQGATCFPEYCEDYGFCCSGEAFPYWNWDAANPPCPGGENGNTCPGDSGIDDICCDMSVGRCCEPDGTINTCNDSIYYDTGEYSGPETPDDCNEPDQTFSRGETCPDCDTDFISECCAGSATIGDLTFTPDVPVVDSSVTVATTVQNNADDPVYTFTVDGEFRQETTSNTYQIPRNTENQGSESDAGKELECTVSVTGFDGNVVTKSDTRYIDGESFEMPSDLPASVSVVPGSDWNGGNGKINQNDLVGLNIDPLVTIPQGVDPPVTVSWQFEQSDGTPVSSGTGISATYTIPEDALPGCELYIDLTFSNVTENADSTTEQSLTYKIGDIFNTVPNQQCGIVTGACCRPAPEDDNDGEGIVGNKCDQQTAEDCTTIYDGEYQGDGSICPTSCGDNSDGSDPCCPQIKTGKCCCTQQDNTGQCVDGITYASCNRTNSDFLTCAQSYDVDDAPDGSLTGDPLWTIGEDCDPGCLSGVNPETGEIQDRCCDVLTGRCCYIDENGDRACETNFTLEDCYAAQDAGADPDVGGYTDGGSCPTCEVPEENSGEPCCDPLGRCCLRTGNELRDITYDITDAACEQRRISEGYAEKDWTQNDPLKSSVDSGLELDCTDPAVASANPNCCLPLGRCCYRPQGSSSNGSFTWDNGKCFRNQTEEECIAQIPSCPGTPGQDNEWCRRFGICCGPLASDTQAEDFPYWNWDSANPECPGDTQGGNCPGDVGIDNYCCDISRGRCCEPDLNNFGTCDGGPVDASDNPIGVLYDVGIYVGQEGFNEVPGDCNESTQTFSRGEPCPDCAADFVIECCTPEAVLTIDSFTVDGDPYDSTTNPIKVGSVVSVTTTEQNVENVSYQFTVFDAGAGTLYDIGDNSTRYTVEAFVPGVGSGNLAGLELNFEVTADSGVDDSSLSASIAFHDPEDSIHGIPPEFPDDINIIFPNLQIFPFNFIDPPVTLSYGDIVYIGSESSLPENIAGIPSAEISFHWADNGGELIPNQTGAFYQISGDGRPELCGLQLQVTLKNDFFGGNDIPGGAEISRIYDIGDIQGPDDTFCGTAIGRCCVQGNFVQMGTLSDNQPWGITYSDCSIEDQTTCINDLGGVWDDDINDCSVCSSAPTDHNDTDMGLAPCCDEIPGRCCDGGVCDDFVLFVNCGGNWTSYYEDNNLCADSCPAAGEVCGCPTTGACCCGGDQSPPCYNNILEEDCSAFAGPANPCGGGVFPSFQGVGTSCPSETQCADGDTPGVDSERCCEEPPESLDSYVGTVSFNYTCYDFNPGGAMSSQHRCDGVSTSGNMPLLHTSPCDYREITTGFGDRIDRCDINSICSCFVENNNPGCGGFLHNFGYNGNSTGESLNLVSLCEQTVCAIKPDCCEDVPGLPPIPGMWSSQCVALAEQNCTLSNLIGSISESAAEEMSNVLRKDYPTCPEIGDATPCIDDTIRNLIWSSCKTKLGVPEGSGQLCGEVECPLGQVCSDINEQCANWSCDGTCEELFPSVCQSGFYVTNENAEAGTYRWQTTSTTGCVFEDNLPYDISGGGGWITIGPGGFLHPILSNALSIRFGSSDAATSFIERADAGARVILDINGITKEFYASAAVQGAGSSSFIVNWKYFTEEDVKSPSGIRADDIHDILSDMDTGRDILITMTRPDLP